LDVIARIARLLAAARNVALLALTLSALAAGRLAAETPADLPGALQALQDRAPSATASGDGAWGKRWWIEKTARLLRGGEGLGPADDVDALLRLPEEEIARRFMADRRFGDTILDFNMYFLGFKIDSLKQDGLYRRNAFDFPNAVASAQALLTGGDYLKLFDLKGPFYMAPLPLEFDDPLPANETRLPAETVRIKAIDEVEAVYTRLIAMGSGPVPPAADDFCYEIEKVLEGSSAMHTRLLRAFNDPEIFVLRRGQVLTRPMEIIARAYHSECEGKAEAKVDVKHLTAEIRRAFDYFYRVIGEVLKHEPSNYRPQSVLDFRQFDLGAFGMKTWLAFGWEQSNALKNSSTNFNRKRGAYVLKRFFCDDLTPVGFDTPKEHVAGAHGSDTTCYACHYKLDPMAGFFRNLGADFYNYGRALMVVFDDDANSDRTKYETNWAAAPGSPRKWNVGYIRSPRWEDANAYGNGVGDLSRIMRASPEPKRCLMKRLYQYLVAEDQAIDGAYLDALTRKFEAEAAVNSSTAMKNAIVRIVSSNAYRKQDADPRRCYDRAPRAKSEGAPPCSVAYILEKNCAQCHSGAEPSGGLELTKWTAPPGGTMPSFPHRGADGKTVTPHETFARLVERLSTSDPARRMPKQMAMPSQERQALFLWAQEEHTRLAKGAAP
jgi:hypothetical protein